MIVRNVNRFVALCLPVLAACSDSSAPAATSRAVTVPSGPALALNHCTNVGATFTVPVESARAVLPPDFEPVISGTGPAGGATLYVLGVRCEQTQIDGVEQGVTTMAYAELAVTPPFEFAVEGITDYTVPLFFAATPDAVGNALDRLQIGQAGTVTWQALTPAGGMAVTATMGNASFTLTAAMAPTPPAAIGSGGFVVYGVEDKTVRSIISASSQGGESVQGVVSLESRGGPALLQEARPVARGFSVRGFGLNFAPAAD